MIATFYVLLYKCKEMQCRVSPDIFVVKHSTRSTNKQSVESAAESKMAQQLQPRENSCCVFSYEGIKRNNEIKHLITWPGDYLQLVHGEKELAELSQRFKVVELTDAVLRQVQLQQRTLGYEGSFWQSLDSVLV